MQDLIPKLIVLAVTAFVAFVLDRLTNRALRRFFEATSLPSASIFVNIVRVVIWSLALISVLKPVFGVEPTAFVAALGVGSVALSLGLQVTISNIIGGLTITTSKVVEPGDMVTVSGVTGEVTDITWRHTVVTDAAGSATVVPNSVMNSSTVVRLSEKAAHKTTFLVEVRPGADLDQAAEDARARVHAALVDAGLAWDGAETTVLMDGINSFGGQMTVVLFVADPKKLAAARDVATKALGACDWLAG